ncbi:variable large family protein [Borrelia duttonii]
MVMMVVMGCNSGGVKDPEKVFLSDIANLGKGFLDVFVNFGDMVSDVIGIKADTKKSDIGKYFSDIEKSMQAIKVKLREILEKNGKYEKIKTVVDKFITDKLDKITEGAKEVSNIAEGAELLGNMVTSDGGGAVGEVDKLIKGMKTIIDVLDLKEGNPDAGTDKKAKDGSTSRAHNSDDAGNLFGNDKAGAAAANAKEAATDAAKAVGAITGADILKAISSGKATALANNNSAYNNVAAVTSAKDGVVAGALALRAMAKGGKFAGNDAANDAVTIVKDAASSAVNKALSTLVIAIRSTVDSGLKTINEALASVNQGDVSTETNE